MTPAIKKSFALCLGLLVAIELSLRLTLPASFTGNFDYGYSPTQGFVEDASGMVKTVPEIARDLQPQTFSAKRANGKTRIIALGDSVEYWSGPGVHVLADTYPVRAARELSTNGLDCETINLAVTGYGSLRNQLLLQRALGYQPSVILLKLNTVNEGTDESNRSRANEFRTWRSMNWPRRSYLVQTLLILKEHLLMQRLLVNDIIVQSRQGGAPKKSAASPDFSNNARFIQTVQESVQLARAQKIPVILICQSFLKKEADGTTSLTDEGLETVANKMKGEGVEVFSFCDTLRGLPADKIFADHVHLTREGHEIVSHALSQRILKLLAGEKQP